MANVHPENTLQAFRGTLACGVNTVEPDCWLTRDGGLVCMHDGSLDRTTDGSGAADRLTTAGMRALDRILGSVLQAQCAMSMTTCR
jgi:glycerophosphoryl diester phosphodiesterase